MRTFAACACALAVLALTACGSARDVASSAEPHSVEPSDHGTSAPAEPTAPPSVAPTPNGTPPARGLPKIVGEVPHFSSPSRNIACEITQTSVRCDIEVHSYQPPPEPDGCDGMWGTSLQVGDAAAAHVCVTDSKIGAEEVLEYGTSTVLGDFGCTSRRSGMTCLNVRTDHGFKISRAKITVF